MYIYTYHAYKMCIILCNSYFSIRNIINIKLDCIRINPLINHKISQVFCKTMNLFHVFKYCNLSILIKCIITNINSDTKWHSSYGFSYCLHVPSKTFFYGNLFIIISNRGSQVCLTFKNKCWKHYTHYNQFINQFGAIFVINFILITYLLYQSVHTLYWSCIL